MTVCKNTNRLFNRLAICSLTVSKIQQLDLTCVKASKHMRKVIHHHNKDGYSFQVFIFLTFLCILRHQFVNKIAQRNIGNSYPLAKHGNETSYVNILRHLQKNSFFSDFSLMLTVFHEFH